MANDALTGGKLEKVLAALDANWQAESIRPANAMVDVSGQPG